MTSVEWSILKSSVFALSMMALIYFVVPFTVIGLTFMLRRSHLKLFEYRSPFWRVCKKCGAHQQKYCWSWQPVFSSLGWWEEMYPIGNNPECKCHSKADNHG